jgi:hypothetical protein
MWPRFDAYDLRVPLPGGRVWAVDVKDWANPALLSKNIREFRAEPPYDQAFVVIPQYRFKIREDYKRVFRHHLADELRGTITICSDTEFVKRVRREVKNA